MVFSMRNTVKRQNEATEGEKKRLKSDYYRRQMKKRNLATYNNVSIIMPCGEFYISPYKIHTAGPRNMEEVSYCTYTVCMIFLIHTEKHGEFSF